MQRENDMKILEEEIERKAALDLSHVNDTGKGVGQGQDRARVGLGQGQGTTEPCGGSVTYFVLPTLHAPHLLPHSHSLVPPMQPRPPHT